MATREQTEALIAKIVYERGLAARLARIKKDTPPTLDGKLKLNMRYRIIDKRGNDVTKERTNAIPS